MSAPILRGWCPTAHRPMHSSDGLVVRIRPQNGRLSPDQAVGMADLAQRYGHATIDLTNRANLQIRGVSDADHALLIKGLLALDLVSPNAAADRLNIILDPMRPHLADDHQETIARLLSVQLQKQEFALLPAKFGIVIDTGPQRRLTRTSGDVRIEASKGTLLVRADGLQAGRKAGDPKAAVDLALALVRWFMATKGVDASGRGRMAQHVASGASLPDALQGGLIPNPAANIPAPGPMAQGLLVAAAFGQMTSDDLRALAACATTGLHVTPWRMIYLPAPRRLPVMSPSGNLITDPGDPLLRVDACPGAAACPQASVETRGLARRLAPMIPAPARLHVSGCAKGCARSQSADLTLVGRDGRFDLIRNGTAKSAPETPSLAPDLVPHFISR